MGHWGPLLVDVQATDPAAQLRAIGQTLAWPVRLLGQAAPGDILLSPAMGPLVEGWCEVQAREVSLPGGQPGRIRGVRGGGEQTPSGPGWRGRGGVRSVHLSAGTRSSQRWVSGYSRSRAAEDRWWA